MSKKREIIVAGFAFTPNFEEVLLIKHEGILYACGGPLVENESFLNGMRRLGYQVGGLDNKLIWHPFCSLSTADATTYCMYTVDVRVRDYEVFSSKMVSVLLPSTAINIKNRSLFGNIPWLIGLAAEHHQHKRPFMEPDIIYQHTSGPLNL